MHVSSSKGSGTSKNFNSKDVIMLLLAARGHANCEAEPIMGRVRLMKMVFLFEKEIKPALRKDSVNLEDIEFMALHYGPYSAKVYDDLNFLEQLGFIRCNPLQVSEPMEQVENEYDYYLAESALIDSPAIEPSESRIVYEYRLVDRGIRFCCEVLHPRLDSTHLSLIDEFKARCTSLPLPKLLYYVYTKYPKSTENSTIKDEILRGGGYELPKSSKY